MPPPQELILSACSSETTASTLAGRAASAPALHLHELLSSSHVQSFKTSVSALNTAGYVLGKDGAGGTVMAVQEGKAIVHVWAWQKDQMHLKLHLPERLLCFNVSPNGCWAVGGSATGQIYLWELSSGLLLASFSAHYRDVVSLTFSQDSHLLLSASLDSAVHVYLVSRLVDDEAEGGAGGMRKPYGSLTDHTLAVRAVCLGRTAGSHGGRCWTASDDGTVKMWSLYPPFNLLCTFSFPPTVTPTTLAVDPSERFIYVGSQAGDVYFIPLFRRRQGLGEREMEAVGGGEVGAPPIKADGAVISAGSPITCLALSLSATHLLIGTQKAEIHIHSLPSHQHMRTIAAHAGPITHLSTMLRPPDLVGAGGTTVRHDARPIMEIKPFERIRAGRAARDVQESTLLLRPTQAIDSLRPPRPTQLASLSSSNGLDAAISNQVSELTAENKRLRASLERAIQINEKMWHGVVDMGLNKPTNHAEQS